MKSITLSLLLLSVLCVFGQSETADTKTIFENKFFNNFQIRQSFQGKIEKEEAAFLNIVNPTGKESSFNYNIALGYTLDYKNWIGTLFIEAQKNTLSTKLQDVFLTGVFLEKSLFENQKWGWSPYMVFKNNYKNDYEKNTESFQSSLSFAPSFDGDNFLFPDCPLENKYLHFDYNIYFGLEYENRFQAPTEINEGNTARYSFRVTSKIYPFADYLDKNLEIIPDYTYRNAFINENKIEVDENKIFKLDVNVMLFKKEISDTKKIEFKFGVSYVNGSDPTKGFEKQEITTYSFKLKI